MDYFQGVVAEYLRANRATFVNSQFFLQLDAGLRSPPAGRSWYVNILAASFAERTAWLVEVTYAKGLNTLIDKLTAWQSHWPLIQTAIHRDAAIPESWTLRPWLFVPEADITSLVRRLPASMVAPRITPLEMTVPWNKHCTWDRHGELPKPKSIPPEMT